MRLEEAVCYNCGSQRYVVYDSENGFSLVRCSQCALLYVNPRPCAEEISRAMMTGMHRGEQMLDVSGPGFDERKRARYLQILDDVYGDGLCRVAPGARWLDIGCGYGEFMVALNEYVGGRISVSGSEPMTAKLDHARARGLDVDFLDLDRHAGRFEYVSLLNVWSHLPDPVDVIRRWKRLLAPGGEMLIETGHSSHLSNRDHHKPYYLPDHLSFASREIVVGILERLGFEIVSTHLYRHSVFVELRPMAILRELARIGLGRGAFRNIFPRQPDRDLYVRARLVSGT